MDKEPCIDKNRAAYSNKWKSAIGGTIKQCKKIVVTEALIYACGGGALGIALGIRLHYYIYIHLVGKYLIPCGDCLLK